MALRRSRIKGVVVNVGIQRRKNVGETQIKSEILESCDAKNAETRIKELKEDTDDLIIESGTKSQNNETKNRDSTPVDGIQSTEDSCQIEPLPLHRNILKIPDSVRALGKWSEHNSEDEDRQDNIENMVNISETKVSIEKPLQIDARCGVIPTTQASANDFTLDETILSSKTNMDTVPEETNESGNEKSPGKLIHVLSNAVHSDTEYPPPPPSPNKMNRSRIKAVPRFGFRKTSVSASESEDECRKHSRIRNDSVCSTTSVMTETIGDCLSPQRPKEVTVTMAPRKCNRSEQTRKLAEARREFQRRFGANVPDRKKLTMMDFIFYNPISNRIEKEDKPKQDTADTADNPDDPAPENPAGEIEIVDDSETQKGNADDNSDEENAMPVPQIKIGPSGEITLDEASLVVENKKVKRQREAIQKSKIIDRDVDTGYGIYKKHKRSKNWSHEETVRFYKAINMIGTDFTLMCELFPNRNRRELKMKFKKEERINNDLLNRAVMQPCSFEFDELKNEAAMREKEMEELKKLKEDTKKKKLEESKMKEVMLAEKARKRKAAPTENAKIIKPPKSKTKIPKKFKRVKLDIDAYADESDADESDLATQSGSDEEIVIPQGPTRSGRVPKVTQKYENELYTVENLMKRNRLSANMKPSDVKPGSIMIISEVDSNGELVHKMFMVTPEHTVTLLNIPSDKVYELIQLKKSMTTENTENTSNNVPGAEVVNPVENNLTIPADDTVTTMKTRLLKEESIALTSGDEAVQVNKGLVSEYESDASIPAEGARTSREVNSAQNYVVMTSEN